MAMKASGAFCSNFLENTYLRPLHRPHRASIRSKAFSTSLSRTAIPSTISTATPPRYTRRPTPNPTSTTKPSSVVSSPARFTNKPLPTVAATAAAQAAEPLPSTNNPSSQSSSDTPLILDESAQQVDWTRSFHGLGAQPFAKVAADLLQSPIPIDDIECKPDGILYLPEIKYRRILNRAFGPGGWGLAPRGETIVTDKSVNREYALVANGRLVSVSRGEQDFFSPEGIPTAAEGCKSNALMRCCKDLGVASELWDPRFIRKFMKEQAKQVWVEHVVTKKKKQIWLRKDDEVRYPFKETK